MAAQRGVLLGLGGVARQAHLPAFLEGDGVADRLRLVGTVDAGRRGVAGLTHLARRDRISELGPIDFIDVCTPTASHLELTLWGLESGYHVLCEKPVALTSHQVNRIAAAAGPAGRVVMGCHQHRFNPAWQKLREWLDAGAIGDWHLAEFQVYRLAADAGAAHAGGPWRGRRAEALGGVLLDHGTHLIYQLLDVAGMPRMVQAWAGRLRHRSYDVEDTAQLLLEFEDRVGMLFLTWAADRRETRIRFTGSDGSIEWSGGRLRLTGRHGPLEEDFTAQLDKASYAGWFASLFHQFADRIERADTSTSLEDIARVTQVLEAAYGAHASGCRVAI